MVARLTPNQKVRVRILTGVPNLTNQEVHYLNKKMKTVKFRPNISPKDFSTKMKNIEKFILKGHNVKVIIHFRGREIIHQDNGKEILNSIKIKTNHIAHMQIQDYKMRDMVAVLQVRKR